MKLKIKYCTFRYIKGSHTPTVKDNEKILNAELETTKSSHFWSSYYQCENSWKIYKHNHLWKLHNKADRHIAYLDSLEVLGETAEN